MMNTTPSKSPRTRIALLASVLVALALAVIVPVAWFPRAPAASAPVPPIASPQSAIPGKPQSVSDIDLGRDIAKASCARCHLYYEPASRTAEQWRTILPRMIEKSALSAEKGRQMGEYFRAGAK